MSYASPRIVVVGAGAIGAWTALSLLRGGSTVTLIDAWGPANYRAGSGGESRIIRATYGPDAIYVDLVARSFEPWRSLDRTASDPLYTETGVLWMFAGDGAYARSSQESLERNGLQLEELSPAGAQARFPQFRFENLRHIYFEPQAGVLAAEKATRAVRDRFLAEGGHYRRGRALPPDESSENLSRLGLADGKSLEGDAFVFAAGAWLGEVLPEALDGLVQPSRQEVYFVNAEGAPEFQSGRLPVWMHLAERLSYGLPALEAQGCKIGDDTRGQAFDPTDGDRTASQIDLERLRDVLQLRLPGLARSAMTGARVCQYENTPDGHLIVDRHPTVENIWIAGGSSGHAFKLGPAIGEHVADMILGGGAPFLEFRLDRFDREDAGAEEHRSQYDS